MSHVTELTPLLAGMFPHRCSGYCRIKMRQMTQEPPSDTEVGELLQHVHEVSRVLSEEVERVPRC